MTNSPNEAISKSAIFTAYLRSLSDIPYSLEMYQALMKRQPRMLIQPSKELAPQYEARHKIINKLLLDSGITQVVEVAAGFSTRAVELAEQYQLDYVETDLANVVDVKRAIIADIVADVPNSLTYTVVNALNADELMAATNSFDTAKPVAIINEGLMRYLNFDQKARYAGHVGRILHQFGGVWITPDITLNALFEVENALKPDSVKTLSSVTNTDLSKNSFMDVAAAQAYFEGLGYQVTCHRLMDMLPELTSPAKVRLNDEQVERVLAAPVAFSMRLIK